MKRLSMAMLVTVGVTGLFGAGRVLADMSSGSSSGGASSGGGAASAGGWTGAPPPSKFKGAGAGTGLGAPTVVSKTAGPTTVANKAPATPAESKTVATAAAPAASKAGASTGGIFPMVMAGADSKVEVKNLENGVTFTITSADRVTATRLQKMAEAMRLMNEAMRL